jgi:hypothetical protein
VIVFYCLDLQNLCLGVAWPMGEAFVDMFYVRKWENLSTIERKAGLQMSFQECYLLILEPSLRRKVNREWALKLQGMKKCCSESFLCRCPF